MAPVYARVRMQNQKSSHCSLQLRIVPDRYTLVHCPPSELQWKALSKAARHDIVVGRSDSESGSRRVRGGGWEGVAAVAAAVLEVVVVVGEEDVDEEELEDPQDGQRDDEDFCCCCCCSGGAVCEEVGVDVGVGAAGLGLSSSWIWAMNLAISGSP